MNTASDRLFRRVALGLAVALAAVLPLPLLLGLANPSYLAIHLATLPLWLGIAALHDAREREVVLRIAVIALAARVLAHFALYAWSSAGGGPYLGPDSTMYFRYSQALATRNFAIDGTAPDFFGSYDCGHYYLFAAARKFFGADLYGLQTLNLALTAFAGPLFYSAWRGLRLPHALALGVSVALYPSIIALSVNDLLKDPSIFGATAVGAWALIRLSQASRRGEALVLTAIAALSLIYVRTARFYVVAFLEAGIVAAVAARWLWMRSRQPVRMRTVANVGLLVALILVEAVPAALDWPLTPQLLGRAVAHTIATPQMREYAGGLFDGGSPTTGGVGTPPREAPAAAKLDGLAADAPAFPGAGTAVEEPEASPPLAIDVPASTAGRMLQMGVNGVRKLMGPFPWITPPVWTPRVVLLGDYLLFPGTLLWYGLLPFAGAGLLVLAWKILQRQSVSLPLMALVVFTMLLMAQYMALNLSYRQREFMVPFLAGAALAGLPHLVPLRGWKVAYGTYWLLIVVMAVAHLAVRAAAG